MVSLINAPEERYRSFAENGRTRLSKGCRKSFKAERHTKRVSASEITCCAHRKERDTPLICAHTAQIDTSRLPKEARVLPSVIHVEGERILTTWTDMHFGGRRQWFLCLSCDRRCVVIYKKGRAPLWGCRKCLDGRYASEHKSSQARRLQKAFKIRKRLEQMEGNLNLPFPERPRHMQHRTYERVRDEAKELELEIGIHNIAFMRNAASSPSTRN